MGRAHGLSFHRRSLLSLAMHLGSRTPLHSVSPTCPGSPGASNRRALRSSSVPSNLAFRASAVATRPSRCRDCRPLACRRDRYSTSAFLVSPRSNTTAANPTWLRISPPRPAQKQFRMQMSVRKDIFRRDYQSRLHLDDDCSSRNLPVAYSLRTRPVAQPPPGGPDILLA